MLHAIIIDDEQHAIESLAGLLALYCPSVRVAGFADNVEEGLELIRQQSPGLVFLDVHIGEATGFELLEQLREAHFQLIFTTGHSEYAIKAFRYNAIDYLLKPIDPAQLTEAVEKANQQSTPRLDTRQLENLIHSLATKKLEKITIAAAEGFHFVEVPSIIRIEGEGNYATFYLQDGEQVVASRNLKTYEELLPGDQFIKTHQSHIVNLHCVKKLLQQEGSILQMADGSEVPLARRRKDAVVEALRGL
ncbi:MAG: response regulator transcription factor [Lewinellaceae bacterium]|nr:response regulator transcription factor [Phaeodactylibacter sp.]MCB9039857.1 response regulator transcription factor [Lewinellaceae bacterium]